MNYLVINIHGMTAQMIEAATVAAEKVVESELIKELWLCPDRNTIYVGLHGVLPSVAVPHSFAVEQTVCQ
jgi:hypothetical protein